MLLNVNLFAYVLLLVHIYIYKYTYISIFSRASEIINFSYLPNFKNVSKQWLNHNQYLADKIF